jgi:excisionase family DNA binding protein
MGTVTRIDEAQILLRIEQVAEQLQVTTRTVQRLIKRHQDPLPHVNVTCGKRPLLRFRASAVEQWLERQTA